MRFKADDRRSRLAPPVGRSQHLLRSRAEFRFAKRLPATSCINNVSQASHTSFSLTAEHRQFAIANRKTSVMRSTDVSFETWRLRLCAASEFLPLSFDFRQGNSCVFFLIEEASRSERLLPYKSLYYLIQSIQDIQKRHFAIAVHICMLEVLYI